MKEYPLSNLVDPIRELVYQYEFIIRGYKEKNNLKIAGYFCDSFPLEIVSSFGYVPLRIPSILFACDCCRCNAEGPQPLSDIYDIVILPGQCANKNCYMSSHNKIFPFRVPGGYGHEHVVELKRSIQGLKEFMGIPDFEIESGFLREITGDYNDFRRLLRGISAIRKTRPGLLPNKDLMIIYEASAVLPFELIAPYLIKILTELQAHDCQNKKEGITSFVYASFMEDGSLLDDIEELGYLIAEDDLCNGRRQFDISLNPDSGTLYEDILDAYSYRPLCPSKRSGAERHELLYKMLKGHDIELVIFLEDHCCSAKKRDIDFLRVRLMRSGVDPVVVSAGQSEEVLKDYWNNSRKGKS